MKEDIPFENLLRSSVHVTISDIVVNMSTHIVFFKADGHQYCTVGSYVYHENHPFFDHPITRIQAKNIHTPEGIEKEQKQNKEINESLKLWYKHKEALYKIIFIKAVEILGEKGEKAFMEFVEHHFFISEEDKNCQGILNKLESSPS